MLIAIPIMDRLQWVSRAGVSAKEGESVLEVFIVWLSYLWFAALCVRFFFPFCPSVLDLFAGGGSPAVSQPVSQSVCVCMDGAKQTEV